MITGGLLKYRKAGGIDQTLPQKNTMKKTLFALTLVATFGFFAAAQDKVVSVGQGEATINPPFCPPKTCLYYAGDFNTNDSNANGVYNTDNTQNDLEGAVWVGVKPNRDVTVTGATFNQCFAFNLALGVNPTPFTVQVGIKPGHAGRVVCNTSGNAALAEYNASQLCEQGSYTIKKLSKSCSLKRGTTYYVNLLPIYDNGNYGTLMDVEDANPVNHRGWKNVIDDSYFNGAGFGANYETTWGRNGYCKGYGCDAFSIALTGTKTK